MTHGLHLAQRAGFLLVVLLTLTGISGYIWSHMRRALPQRGVWERKVRVVWFAWATLGLTATVLSRLLPSSSGRVFATLAYSWLGAIYLLLVASCAAHVALISSSFFARLSDKRPKLTDVFTTRVTRILMCAAGVTTLCSGVAAGWLGPQTVPVDVTLNQLPKEQDGLTIAQLSDLHITPYFSARHLERVVLKAMDAAPDLVVLTGDLVDGEVDELKDKLWPLKKLRAPLGVFFCTGNHEYYNHADAWADFLPQLGIQVLRNSRVTLGRGAKAFELVGVEDYSAFKYPSRISADLSQALGGRDPQLPVVLLAHQPKHAFEAERSGVDLMLSGHTHGGLPWPFYYPVKIEHPCLSGLNVFGTMQVYVNSGGGFWGLPMKPFQRPEVTLMRLHAPLSREILKDL